MTNKTTWIQVAERLWEIQKERKELNEQASILKNTLVELSGHKSRIEGEFIFKLNIKKGSVNYNAIPELQKIDLEQYRRPEVKSWSLISAREEN